MNKEHEKAFFSLYDGRYSIVGRCIAFIQETYGLYHYPKKPKRERLTEIYEWPCILAALIEFLEKSYWLQEMAGMETSPLIDEIEQNLKECKSQAETDRYIFSLLFPFKDFCDLLHPIARIEQAQDKDASEQFKETSNKFHDLLFSDRTNGLCMEKGTVEYCLRCMAGYMFGYADRLFAMLIQYDIDFRQYQQKAGVYIKRDWHLDDIDVFVGSMELAQHYLDKLKSKHLDDEQHHENSDEARTKPEKSQQSPPKSKISISINESGLRKYFNMAFQNKGYFGYLISDIKDLCTVKDCRIVAKMIYETDSGFINSFPTFAAWCRTFFMNIGLKVKEGYNFSKTASPTDELKRKFYYLNKVEKR